MNSCQLYLPSNPLSGQQHRRKAGILPKPTRHSENIRVAPLSIHRSESVKNTLLSPPHSLTRRRSTLRCQSSFGGKSPEQALKSTVELNSFIDSLRSAPPSQLGLRVAESILAFDRTFWLHLAVRADSAESVSEKEELQNLAGSIMGMVEAIVRKTQEKMNTSTDVLTDILSSVADENGEIEWPPRDAQRRAGLRKAVEAKALEGFINEEFLGAASAQLRQVSKPVWAVGSCIYSSIERGDRPGLTALLQKVLQICASITLAKRSYATRPDGSVDDSEALLEKMLLGEEEEWEAVLRSGLAYGGGSVSGLGLLSALDLRMERTMMRTEGGSYEQRVVGEYLREVEERSRAMINAFESAETPRVQT